MIRTTIEFIKEIQKDLSKWESKTKPWFRGEAGDDPPLCPKIASFQHNKENYLLQSFRRQAGGLANVPHREQTDMWLFMAQHYGVQTRLLDWTEGALLALYFAINEGKPNPRIYMLNPRKLNDIAGLKTSPPNYPLSWFGGGSLYISLAWQNRNINDDQQNLMKELNLSLKIPTAFPATYQDQRMIAQRSCFTIHGLELKPIQEILTDNDIELKKCLFEYTIDIRTRSLLLQELSILGISAATIFPDLDHLARDLMSDI